MNQAQIDNSIQEILAVYTQFKTKVATPDNDSNSVETHMTALSLTNSWAARNANYEFTSNFASDLTKLLFTIHNAKLNGNEMPIPDDEE